MQKSEALFTLWSVLQMQCSDAYDLTNYFSMEASYYFKKSACFWYDTNIILMTSCSLTPYICTTVGEKQGSDKWYPSSSSSSFLWFTPSSPSILALLNGIALSSPPRLTSVTPATSALINDQFLRHLSPRRTCFVHSTFFARAIMMDPSCEKRPVA